MNASTAQLFSFQFGLLTGWVGMTSFIERYPNWDQYRLVQAALAGFLVQNGVESREITRLYVGNMFRRQSLAYRCNASRLRMTPSRSAPSTGTAAALTSNLACATAPPTTAFWCEVSARR